MVITMADGFDFERRRLMRILGDRGMLTQRPCKDIGIYRKVAELAAGTGILAGIPGGATFAVAMMLAEKAALATMILSMLPDTGERYMSTPPFKTIGPEMNAKETTFSKSTPGCQVPE